MPYPKKKNENPESAGQSIVDPKTEYRSFNFEIESIEKRDDGQRKIIGHAAVFDEIGDAGWFQEIIDPGAFKKSIKNDDVRALIDHIPHMILGRNKSGTLKLKEDDIGLAIEINPPDTQYARDLIVSIDREDITQMSFSFIAIVEEWERTKENKPDIRTLKEVKLFDVSPVTYPFYEGTDVAMRSHQLWLDANDTQDHKRDTIRKLTINVKEITREVIENENNS